MDASNIENNAIQTNLRSIQGSPLGYVLSPKPPDTLTFLFENVNSLNPETRQWKYKKLNQLI